ncbi:MAG TPA: peptidoglycan-binding protein [Baekduia sp.]|nr:peptidoglycan-binding protein [Baekduia sp.]
MRRVRSLIVLSILAAVMPAAAAAGAQAQTPHLGRVRCVPPTSARCAHGVRVRIGNQIQLRGRGLARGMRVTFRWPLGAIATKLRRTRAGWVVRVPAGVRVGRVSVYVSDRHWRRSRMRRVRILPDVVPSGPTTEPQAVPGALPDVLRGDAMWIWQLDHAESGNVDAIAARAQQAGIRTVLVKAADGTDPFPQFSRPLVDALHAHGLGVCAWQFAYGTDPAGEARAAVAAIRLGADCFVIDAESHYEGRYAQAQEYLTAIRAAVGAEYPIGLTSFPYVDYHPGLPFSVFLGPGGAQANLPQIYWKAIGDTVDAASAHTFAHNRIYGTPMAPIGQTYDGPPAPDLRRFRQVWAAYGAAGLSWWSWQHTSAATWTTLGEPAPAPATVPDPGWPALHQGSKGDEVVWLQEHLASTNPAVKVNGVFDAATGDALAALQTAHQLPASRQTDAATWEQVLALPLQPQSWLTAAHGTTASAAAVHRRRPRSARLPARRREIPPPQRRR